MWWVIRFSTVKSKFDLTSKTAGLNIKRAKNVTKLECATDFGSNIVQTEKACLFQKGIRQTFYSIETLTVWMKKRIVILISVYTYFNFHKNSHLILLKSGRTLFWKPTFTQKFVTITQKIQTFLESLYQRPSWRKLDRIIGGAPFVNSSWSPYSRVWLKCWWRWPSFRCAAPFSFCRGSLLSICPSWPSLTGVVIISCFHQWFILKLLIQM